MACTTGQTPDRSAAPPRPDWLRPLGRTSVALLLTAALVLCFKPGWRRADSPLSVPNAVANAVAAQTLPTKSIQDVRVGDRVVARDTETGRSEAKRVARVFRRTSDHLRLLTVRSLRNGTVQQLKTTDEHPFWMPAQGWVDAGDLAVGDQLLQQDGGLAVVVSTDHEPHPEGVPVYNLETQDHHTYYVSAHGSRAPPLLVHNCNSPGKSPYPASLSERLSPYKQWKANAGITGQPTSSQFRRFAAAHRPNSKGATLYYDRSGFADWARRVDSGHGNVALNQPAWLYRLQTDSGEFLKWGVSQDPGKRFSATFMRGKRIIPLQEGPRRQMLTIERDLTERIPGPLNREPWAGAQLGE